MASVLDEILDRLNKMPVEELEETAKAIAADLGGQIWCANPGPQTDAFYCDADELFYGGSAGGGKSDLLFGLALTAHQRSLILRRTNKEAGKLVERLADIIGHRNGWNGQDDVWRFPDGRLIDVGGCQLEHDKQKYKGTPHDLVCVAAGTRVLIADGSHRAIETLQVGDMLATLEGPRRLEKVYPKQRKECVEVVARDECGREIARQIQSVSHALYDGMGWISAGAQAGAYASKECRGFGRILRSLLEIYAEPLTHLKVSIDRLLHMGGCALRFLCQRHSLATNAYDHASYVGSATTESLLSYAGNLPPLRWFSRQEPSEPCLQSALITGHQLSCGHGGAYVRKSSGSEDSKDHYWFDPRRYGERTLRLKDQAIGAKAVQQCLLLRDGVEQPSPSRSLEDASEGIQTHSLERQGTYVHPYTNETRQVSVSGSLRKFSFEVSECGEKDVYDLQVAEVRHYITDGGFINKNCFDEISDFSEDQYRFITTWNRSTTPGQRCRVVAAGNPPTRPEGLWVIQYWAPWLDKRHPKPAKPGELRWYTTIGGEEKEVDGPGPYQIGGMEIRARSRTYIPARLSDNPDLERTDYGAVLAALPKELRAAYLEGRFDAGLKDNPFQVIPTAWVEAAMERWKPDGRGNYAMSAIGFDPAGGGDDSAELAIRYGGWFAPIVSAQGKITEDGSAAAAMVFKHRRDNCVVVIDVGGGYGGSVIMRLNDNGVAAHKFNGAATSTEKARDGSKLSFRNKRSEAHWRMREALDPENEAADFVCLPPDPELKADLCAPTWDLTQGGILIDEKDDIRKRIGRSPNKGDAVIMCLSEGNTAIKKRMGMNHDLPSRASAGYENIKRLYRR